MLWSLEELLKDKAPQESSERPHKRNFAINKFVIGGALIVVAGIILAITSLRGNAQYYLTIDELLVDPALAGQAVRISGVVLGDTIQYDPSTDSLSFTVASIPSDNATIEKMGGLAAALHQAATDPNAKHLNVVYHGSRPDLLKDEAQAIMTGTLGADGTFSATELLLKCPTRYEDSIPAQTGN